MQKDLKNGDDVGNEFGPMFIVSFKFTTNQVHRNALAMVKIIFTKIVPHVDRKTQEKWFSSCTFQGTMINCENGSSIVANKIKKKIRRMTAS